MSGRIKIIVIVATMALAAASVAWSQPRQVLSGRIIIEGTDDSQDLMLALARRFEALHPGTSIEIPQGTGSRGGIIAVLEGRTELARVSRPLNESERKSPIRYVEFARAPVVLAAHPGIRIDDLSAEQIAGIYSGKYINWKQLGGTASKIFPVGREITAPSRLALNNYLPAFEQIRESADKTYYATSPLVEAIERHPGTIGYASMAMVKKTGLKVMKVDGVYPLVMNMRNGKYGAVIPIGVVYKNIPSPLTRAFVDFLYSKDAQNIIVQFGCMPVRR